jgi:hypothetical protein
MIYVSDTAKISEGMTWAHVYLHDENSSIKCATVLETKRSNLRCSNPIDGPGSISVHIQRQFQRNATRPCATPPLHHGIVVETNFPPSMKEPTSLGLSFGKDELFIPSGSLI